MAQTEVSLRHTRKAKGPMTVGELREFLAACERHGVPEGTPVGGRVSFRGGLRELRLVTSKVPTPKKRLDGLGGLGAGESSLSAKRRREAVQDSLDARTS